MLHSHARYRSLPGPVMFAFNFPGERKTRRKGGDEARCSITGQDKDHVSGNTEILGIPQTARLTPLRLALCCQRSAAGTPVRRVTAAPAAQASSPAGI